MGLRGLDRLQQLVPEAGTPRKVLLAALAMAAVFASTVLFFLAADRWFPEWMPDGEIVILALGFLILSRFFTQRKRYEGKYGDRAFQRAFSRFNIPGLGIITASIAHLAYIAGPEIPELWWKPWLAGAGYALIVAGLLLWLRTVTAFGVDSLIMLYVYHPQQGSQFDQGLYGIMRHPIYAATMSIGLGLAFVHGNWYAILVAVLLPLFFAGWVRLVEERELIERFPHYMDYRERVPAFLPRPRDWEKLVRYIAIGGPADEAPVPS